MTAETISVADGKYELTNDNGVMTSCACDYGEAADVQHVTEHRARKTYGCYECQRSSGGLSDIRTQKCAEQKAPNGPGEPPERSARPGG